VQKESAGDAITAATTLVTNWCAKRLYLCQLAKTFWQILRQGQLMML